MGTKTINLMDDAYELLRRAKAPDESFSDVVRRTFSQKKDPLEFFGSWSDLDTDAMKEFIEESKRSESERMEALFNDLS